MASHTSLAATDDRKARLAQLKSLKRKQAGSEAHAPAEETTAEEAPQADVARLHLSGRNYDADTRGPKLGFDAPPTVRRTLEQQASDIVEACGESQAVQHDSGIDLLTLRPKKPNWDLKRELRQKLDVLDVRTDNAIARLVRERLAAKAAARGPDGDAAGLEGAEMVEGMRLREREAEEEQRREREREREEDVAP